MIQALRNRFEDRMNLVIQGSFFVVLLLTLLVRILNINYNSAFADEAVYIIIGTLGLFHNDWWSYNPSSWLAGLPYLYPSIAAVTYAIGGITGSRLFNIILSVLLVGVVFRITQQAFPTKSDTKKMVAATIAALVAGGATIGIVISRLATYDIPSFFFFALSLLFLIRAQGKKVKNGRDYFYAGAFLFLATLTKIIIGVYVPFILVYSWFAVEKLSKKHKEFWFKYFALPLITGLTVYFATNYSGIFAYADISAGRVKESLLSIFLSAWKHLSLAIIFWAVATLGMLKKSFLKIWLLFTALSIVVLLPHFITQRAIPTMEKQTYLSVVLLAPIIGIGLTNLAILVRINIIRVIAFGAIFGSLIFFWTASYEKSRPYNSMWQDTSAHERVIQENILSTDKVLSESGMPFILASFDQVYPHNVTTFDYLSYRGKTGITAYNDAVRDGYFDLIQLSQSGKAAESVLQTRSTVLENLNRNYQKIYEKDEYVLYRRMY